MVADVVNLKLSVFKVCFRFVGVEMLRVFRASGFVCVGFMIKHCWIFISLRARPLLARTSMQDMSNFGSLQTNGVRPAKKS